VSHFGPPRAPHVQAAIAVGQGRPVQAKAAEPPGARPVAAHVQAAIASGQGRQVQPKAMQPAGGRPVAVHVQAAIAAGQGRPVQPKAPAPAAGRSVAAHVQSAIVTGQGHHVQPKAAAPAAGRQVATHVQAAIVAGAGRPLQAKTGSSAPLPPVAARGAGGFGVVQPSSSSNTRKLISEGGKNPRQDVKIIVEETEEALVSFPKQFLQTEKSMKAALRWVATVVFQTFPEGIEIQCYYDQGMLLISSNVDKVNQRLADISQQHGGLYEYVWANRWEVREALVQDKATSDRFERHLKKLYRDIINIEEVWAVWRAFRHNRVIIPGSEFIKYDVEKSVKKGTLMLIRGANLEVHAERRIEYELRRQHIDFNELHLGGAKRPCAVCGLHLKVKKSTRGYYFQDDGAALRVGKTVEVSKEKPDQMRHKTLKQLKLKEGDELVVVKTGKEYIFHERLIYSSDTVRDYQGSEGHGLSYKTLGAGGGGTAYDTDSDDDEFLNY